MTLPRSYRGLDAGRLQRETDRSSWAREVEEVVTWETVGAGNVNTPVIYFKTAFEGEPHFHYGVELGEGLTLAVGDYPFCSAGVAEWGIVQAKVEGSPSSYTSVTLWLTVDSAASYTLRWRFVFGGTALRNREHIPGGA